MRLLWPEPREPVDPWEAYRPADARTPLLRVNMVVGVDGAATDAEGRTAALGGEGDWEIFRALRAQADAVLVGAGTARAEEYGPARVRGDLAARRREELGHTLPPAIVLVSRSLRLDPDSPIFTDASVPTTVLTCAAADADRRAALERVGRVVVAGEAHVDLAAGLARLREEIGPVVTCEGGPTLNAGLLRAGVVDELCVTVAPQLVGMPLAPRLAADLDRSVALSLTQVAVADDGELYLRYEVA